MIYRNIIKAYSLKENLHQLKRDLLEDELLNLMGR